jgi:segregation and condensation protein B
MERELVRISGRAEDLGRPLLYGTTKKFLQVFGLRHLDELPRAEQLRRPAALVTAAPDATLKHVGRPWGSS